MSDQTVSNLPVSPKQSGPIVRFTEFILKWRWIVIALSVLSALAVGQNASTLEFASNYRVFFSDENPDLVAFEEFQATYTKSDNVVFMVKMADGSVFNEEALTAVAEITAEAWKLPFVIRVDSITNFQNTYAIDDDLIVEDLVSDPAVLSPDDMASRQEIALAEPLVRDQLLTRDGSATMVNVVLQLPQVSVDEVPEVATAARELRAAVAEKYDGVEIYLSGVAMLNNAFNEAGLGDLATLIPIMYVILLVVTAVTLRSIFGMLATLVVIILSSMVGMGSAGIMGIQMTPIAATAPTIIMTLAIADSIHVLISMRAAMRQGMAKRDALIEAVRVNFLAITITSLTTMVGFMALNFSDAPPFWHLGNMTAAGIFAAWIYSLTTLPAIVSLLPMRMPKPDAETQRRSMMVRFADWVIDFHKPILAVSVVACVALVAMIPRIDFNDEWLQYFDESIEFRAESDVVVQDFGLYTIEFSMPSGSNGGVSEPEFLSRLEGFTEWLREQPNVTHVYSLVDIMKRLNKNMHGDDPSYFRVPDDRELSAQYLLLYELSLPFGLDLNDRIDIDKKATRVTVTLGDVNTTQTKEFLNNAHEYIDGNFPPEQQTKATSAQVMFTFITDRNVQSMITGTIGAVIAISLIMIFALRSFRLGMLSLIPNGLPIAVTFGMWAILVGEVGFSVATIASVSLGIVVDDTVHLLTKYQRARTEHAFGVADAIRFAFDTVGVALIVNTIILVAGFLVLTSSTFKLNVDMGMLTAMAITFALVLDFLLLPALLLIGRKAEDKDAKSYPAAANAVPAE
ncbi:MAG: MMPL family transporter [Pseudomonadota bacterium]